MTSKNGSVLVTGGCGLIGHHIVQALVKDTTCGPISVISRNPHKNNVDGVTYVAGSVADKDFVERIVTETKPTVIIHAASPRSIDEGGETVFYDTNVGGTQNLIDAAKKSPTTRVFIYTSTVNVIQGNEHIKIAENGKPYWERNSKTLAYWRSKAATEKIVLAANSPELKTAAIRPCLTVGLQEHALIPAQLDTLAQGKTNIQLGDNKNLIDLISAENCANAHLLAMHALLDPDTSANGKVEGEAFSITDDNPLPFWDVQRVIWRTGGDKTELKNVKVLPAWLANSMASMTEWTYGIFFWGKKSPEFNRHVVTFCTRTFTYDISKARRLLGYNPVSRIEEVLKEATEWEMKRRASQASNDKS
ncbi:hypothetical protein MMC10_002778 [Thelotrema lepadinum]|nr:hypothetical protein [Thelotrema lepadinum]